MAVNFPSVRAFFFLPATAGACQWQPTKTVNDETVVVRHRRRRHCLQSSSSSSSSVVVVVVSLCSRRPRPRRPRPRRRPRRRPSSASSVVVVFSRRRRQSSSSSSSLSSSVVVLVLVLVVVVVVVVVAVVVPPSPSPAKGGLRKPGLETGSVMCRGDVPTALTDCADRLQRRCAHRATHRLDPDSRVHSRSRCFCFEPLFVYSNLLWTRAGSTAEPVELTFCLRASPCDALPNELFIASAWQSGVAEKLRGRLGSARACSPIRM